MTKQPYKTISYVDQPYYKTTIRQSTLCQEAQVINAKFPTWEEAISEIEDSRFTELPDKYHVRAGARIMYDRLYIMFHDAAILTSAMHSDGKDQGICGDDHTCLINDRIVKINEQLAAGDGGR